MERNHPPHKSRWLLLVAYLGFISLGLPDAVAAVAWPSLREEFHLAQASFGWLFVAGGCGYFLSSFFAGQLTSLLTVGNLLTVSSLLVGMAMFGNSRAHDWWLLVAFSVLWGLGSGAIDAALNGYVASHFSARHVSWLHACYSTGATLGPLIMTWCVVQADSWRLGYMVVGGSMLTMAALFLASARSWSNSIPADDHATPRDASLLGVLREPIVWMQIVVFFLYTGLENTAGQWSFTLLTEGRGVSAETAGVLVGMYYGSIAVGRVLFGMIAERVGLDRLVRLSALAAVCGAGFFAWGPLPLAGFGLVVLGLGLASIFPTLMTRTPQRLGHAQAAHAIGFQVSAAMLGAATLPSLTGLVAQTWGLAAIGACDVLIAAALWGTHELLLLRSARPAAA
jgi:fucose permease